MKKPVPAAPADRVSLYERLVATNPSIERKGATMPYTSVNGNMFSVLTKDGWLSLRLPEAERAAFLKRYNAKIAVQYGVVTPEYVHVPDALLENTQELKKYFDISYEYTRAVKPKPTTKKTTKTAKATKKTTKTSGTRQ